MSSALWVATLTDHRQDNYIMARNRRKTFSKATQPRRMKICLGIPCVGTVRIETLLSVVAILNSTPHDNRAEVRKAVLSRLRHYGGGAGDQ
jgi:hypothetical protein